MKCPCCGYGGENRDFRSIAAMAKLSILETSIFLLFAENIGRMVTIQEIVSRVYSGARDGGPEYARQTIGVTVYRMRSKLAPFGLKIDGFRRREGGRVMRWAE